MWDAALYILLGLTMALALLDPAVAGDRWLLVALTLLAAGWHLGFRRLGLTDEQPGLALVYLSLLLVLYPQIFRYPRLPWPSRLRWP